MIEQAKTASMVNLPDPFFIATKEYRKFAEFCDACKRERYIGLCFGAPGVGKTYAAEHYSQSEFLARWHESSDDYIPPPQVREYDTAFFTAGVIDSPKEVASRVRGARFRLEHAITCSYTDEELYEVSKKTSAKLIVVDEADRLSATGLEIMRDICDREKISVVLIGMPGIEKRLARYGQLYSRAGFLHEFKSLTVDEVMFLVESSWLKLGYTFNKDDFTDAEALAALVRITQGNFRLIGRLLTQIQRILDINGLSLITKEVIEAARQNLVIGIE